MFKHRPEQIRLINLLSDENYHPGCIDLLIKENQDLLTDKYYLNLAIFKNSFFELDLKAFLKFKSLIDKKYKKSLINNENLFKNHQEKETTFYLENPNKDQTKEESYLAYNLKNQNLIDLLFKKNHSFDLLTIFKNEMAKISYHYDEKKLLLTLFFHYELIFDENLKNDLLNFWLDNYKKNKMNSSIYKSKSGVLWDKLKVLSNFVDNLSEEEKLRIIEEKQIANFLLDVIQSDLMVFKINDVLLIKKEKIIETIKKNLKLQKIIRKKLSNDIESNFDGIVNLLNLLGPEVKKIIDFDKIINKHITDWLFSSYANKQSFPTLEAVKLIEKTSVNLNKTNTLKLNDILNNSLLDFKEEKENIMATLTKNKIQQNIYSSEKNNKLKI